MFRFRALTPNGCFLDVDAEEVLFPGDKGPTAILTGHTPYLGKLQDAGVLKAVYGGKAHYYAVFGGLLSVSKEETVLYTEDIESGEEIDTSRAIASRDRAKDRLEKKDPQTDVKRATAALSRALCRLSAKQLEEGVSK